MLEDGCKVHQLSVSQIHGFLCDNPLVIRGFLHWKNNEPRADNMRFLIGLPDGKELSWKHIKHPILPCQCPRVRSIICEEENGSSMFEKVIAGLHMIQRSVPQMPRAVDVSKEIVNGGFALNAKAMRELSRKLYDGEIVEDALDNKWGHRGKKRKQVMENWSSFELAFPCNFARVDEVGPFWEGQLCLHLRKITFAE